MDQFLIWSQLKFVHFMVSRIQWHEETYVSFLDSSFLLLHGSKPWRFQVLSRCVLPRTFDLRSGFTRGSSSTHPSVGVRFVAHDSRVPVPVKGFLKRWMSKIIGKTMTISAWKGAFWLSGYSQIYVHITLVISYSEFGKSWWSSSAARIWWHIGSRLSVRNLSCFNFRSTNTHRNIAGK